MSPVIGIPETAILSKGRVISPNCIPEWRFVLGANAKEVERTASFLHTKDIHQVHVLYITN